MGLGVLLLIVLVAVLLGGKLPRLPILAGQSIPITESILATPFTPEPTLVNPSQLDMLFLKGIVSADQTTITLDIQINNKGVNPITLTSNDFSITPENGTASPPTTVIPEPPITIVPSESATVSITFPYPNTPSVMLKILDLTVNYSLQ
jgi:hypothetical protein